MRGNEKWLEPIYRALVIFQAREPDFLPQKLPRVLAS
jgi:hypothetical protein